MIFEVKSTFGHRVLVSACNSEAAFESGREEQTELAPTSTFKVVEVHSTLMTLLPVPFPTLWRSLLLLLLLLLLPRPLRAR